MVFSFSYFNGLFDAGMAFTFLPRGRAISARYIIDKTYIGSLSAALRPGRLKVQGIYIDKTYFGSLGASLGGLDGFSFCIGWRRTGVTGLKKKNKSTHDGRITKR